MTLRLVHRPELWNECLLLRPQSQSSTRSASHLACSTGVLLVRANVKSSQSFIRPAMFDLELEWTVGVGGGRRAKIFTSQPLPLSLFLTYDRPFGTNFLLSPSLPLPFKSKMAAIILVKKILSTRPPKLRLLCKLLATIFSPPFLFELSLKRRDCL